MQVLFKGNATCNTDLRFLPQDLIPFYASSNIENRGIMSVEAYIEDGAKGSFKERFKERRGRLEIIADILSVAMEEAKKTEIVYKANLNFKRLGKYLPYLMENGLIENGNMSNEYKTTEKGKEFLRDYQKMEERLS